MAKYEPIVVHAHAFNEISRDFTTPAEIFREAIANAIDAYARRLWLRVHTEQRKGREVLLIDIADDGLGMDVETVKAFLNLSDSKKPSSPPPGMTARRMTGYKGHGTKIYYNSDQLEIASWNGSGKPIYCSVSDPRGELADRKVPTAEISETSIDELVRLRSEWGLQELGAARGTTIRIVGYHGNMKNGLEHCLLRDYILWFTRWGSWEPRFANLAGLKSSEVDDLSRCELYLRGLGKDQPDQDELLKFGHVFPAEDCTDIRKLRGKDDADPLKFYVRSWCFSNVPLKKNPDKRVDFLFAIEGEKARREYNDMLRRQGKPRRPGDYLSEDRYGLWLGRGFIPVERFNDWVSERSEFTRMHAFVNSEDLELTANRGSVENTSRELLEDIKSTVIELFQEQIVKHADFEKFQDELQAIERHRHAKKEADDYARRVKRLESRTVATIGGKEYLAPSSEMDLIVLVAVAQAAIPDLLPFAVREHNSHFGFDGLATQTPGLAPTEAQHLFVEYKFELHREFNHTFEKLEAILCWESKVKSGDEVTDLGGNRGTFNIAQQQDGSRKRFITRPDANRNVEVFVVKELLERHRVVFKPRGE